MKLSTYVIVCIAVVAFIGRSTSSDSLVNHTSQMMCGNDSYKMLTLDVEGSYFFPCNSTCQFVETPINVFITMFPYISPDVLISHLISFLLEKVPLIFSKILNYFLLQILLLMLYTFLFEISFRNFFQNFIKTPKKFHLGSSLDSCLMSSVILFSRSSFKSALTYFLKSSLTSSLITYLKFLINSSMSSSIGPSLTSVGLLCLKNRLMWLIT